MLCPNCQSPRHSVDEPEERLNNLQQIRRVRKCSKCNHTFTTTEKVDSKRRDHT
jgi:transcriptional regulator NrdR family protein